MKSKSVVLLLFLAIPAWAADNAVTDYALAQKCYHALDKTQPSGWGHCIHKFEKVIEKYPASDQVRSAVFSVARLSEEKQALDGGAEDLNRAIQFYNRFLRDYPKDSKADDCLWQIAKLRYEKQGDRERAIKALQALLKRYPNGDKAPEAIRYWNELREPPEGGAPNYLPSEQREREGEAPMALPSEGATRAPITDTIRTIVIDPGHGGEDPGAKGHLGTKESVVALQIAHKLALLLKQQLKIAVHLTRTNHQGLSLEDRARFANRQTADLFISVHANAYSSPELHGIQTFYLNNATSEAARKLEARENKVAGKKLSLSEKILTTMLQNANTWESRDLAFSVQKSLVNRLRQNYAPIEDMNVDTALFYVLVGVKCPSILVETSFITNPKEEKRLLDSQYQWAVAEGIVKGVKGYIDSRPSVPSSL